MQPDLRSSILGWWLVITLVAITAIDIIAIINKQPDATVSRWVYDLGQTHPWVYLLIGLTLGHVLFPLIIRATNGNH